MAERIVCVRCGKEGHHSSNCKLKLPATNARAHLSRCEPAKPCPQECGCVRCQVENDAPVIDASLSLTVHGCELFIDRRGAKLLGAIT